MDTGRNSIVTIPMNSPQIKFIPSGGSEKYAQLLYHPELKTGDYKLFIQASDAAGNKSGTNARIINFRVVEEESITNVLNYPNPFSTSTQFVFTLTGTEAPDVMSISIMTMSGKVVREITKEEIGPLRIGINRTEFKWDGTDEYGSKLGNGVYLYKVNLRNAKGDIYKTQSTNKTDVFFKEGIGKMVILR
ncbi:MAG: T9SS type A sorting domain-containing protein [Saprospiraceae bacterium]|nr:T9SS type A sorting domain-containing protein [Saprospiraceae bacterium]